MRTIIVIVLSLCAGLASAQTYRWVDEDGVVHYSDRPVEGAEEVAIDYIRPSTTPARPPAYQRRDRSPGQAAAEETDRLRYESLEIGSPAEEETVWNNQGQLTVSLALQPGLQPGHRVRVYLDGTPTDASSTTVRVENVYRGAHTLQAEVLDSNGNMVMRSEPRQFFVQQTSVLRN
jgi:hypothetical protein